MAAETFRFEPARLENVGLFVALAGGSTSGKTYSALLLALGIAQEYEAQTGKPGRVAAIDTEGGRMRHHAKAVPFSVMSMDPPFHPLRFVAAARAAQDQGFAAVVIDSFSLEWTGRGGVLDIQREFMVGKEAKHSDKSWDVAKLPHKQMRDEMLQLNIPVIFSLRANSMAKHLGGGWKVEQDSRFIYEWTLALTFHPDTPGMPRYDMRTPKKEGRDLPAWKMPDHFLPLFPQGQYVSIEAGRALQRWRMGKLEIAEADRKKVEEARSKMTVSALIDRTRDDLAQCADEEEILAFKEQPMIKAVFDNGSDKQRKALDAVFDEALRALAQAAPPEDTREGSPSQVTASSPPDDGWPGPDVPASTTRDQPTIGDL